MSDLLLQTKLFRPALRPSLIARPQLIAKLNEALGKGVQGFTARLTLVSAPAGFGKTTAVSAWLAQLTTLEPQYSDENAAWLSLDESDNDLVRFLAYLTAALQKANSNIGQSAVHLLQSPQPPAAETILTLLLNDISQNNQPVILVLEDYHVISTPAVHQAVTFLLDHLPRRLLLLITTRSDPPLSLSRLRARSQIVEIRADDLRFSFDEVSRFFAQAMGLNLSNEELAALEERTEGWVAGLQLAALSMQGRDDLPDFIADFSGSQRLILDFLTDEVLERRPEGTRNFLLQTSILNRLCGPLCDAVTGQSGGRAILEKLEHANLFLVALDEERHWYRYHHLFADVLRRRLQQATDSQSNGAVTAAKLHHRASAWFEQEGFIDEAIQHALAAQDVERAATLVEQYSLLMFQRSEILSVRAWLKRLPPGLVKTRPRLILAQGWALVLTAHGEDIEKWLSGPQASAALSAPDLDPEILGELAIVRATQARFQRDYAQALELAQQAQELLADDDRGLLAAAVYSIAANRLRLGDVEGASQAFSEAVILGETRGGPYITLVAMKELSELQLRQGHLTQVMLTYEKAMRMSARWRWQSMPAVGMAHIYLGQVLYEQNNLIAATQELTTGIDRLRGSTEQFVLATGYVTLSQIQMASGDSEGAFATIQQGEKWLIQMQMGERGAGTLLALGKTRLWLRQGQLEAAARWLENCHWWPEETNIGFGQRLTLVRLRLAQSQLDPQGQISTEVTEMLNRFLALKETGGWFGHVIEISVLQALVCQAQDDSPGAMTALERAFGLAEPEGYVRIFIDEGESMANLLRQAQQYNLFPNYVDRLLGAFTAMKSESGGAELLLDPLSPRELEVLNLIATGSSNREIANSLVVAVPTVKKHVSNIMSKLNATSRTQAVAEARDLGLL